MSQNVPKIFTTNNENCKNHKERYQLYCKNHDSPCCRKCKTENHKKCLDVVNLGDVIRNANTSAHINNIQGELQELLQNFQNVKVDRKTNITNLKEQRKQIEGEMKRLRKDVEEYLNKLENKIVTELNEAETKANAKIQELIVSVEEREKQIGEIQDYLTSLTSNASDLQVFLNLRKIEAVTTEYEHYIQSLLDKGSLGQSELTFKCNSLLQNLSNEVRSFGEISINVNESKIALYGRKIQQAQMMVDHTFKSIDEISLRFKKETKSECTQITGCQILSDDTFVLVSFGLPGKLSVVDNNGPKDFELDLDHLLGVARIDSNTVAVSRYPGTINIIDIAEKSIKRTIKVKHNIQGICYENGTLFCSAAKKGIIGVSLLDDSVTSIVDCDNISDYSNVTANRSHVYFTGGRGSNMVTCCDKKGTTQWQFQDESILRFTQGITVDSEGNIYVVGSNTNKVVLISSDGKHFRVVLSTNDGLQSPSVIHCQSRTKQIIVTNYKQSAFFFDISSFKTK